MKSGASVTEAGKGNDLPPHGVAVACVDVGRQVTHGEALVPVEAVRALLLMG